MGVTDLVFTCGSEPVLDACAAVVGSARTGRALDAGSDLQTYATLATHDGHCLTKMMPAYCTRIISAEEHGRLLATDIVSYRNMVVWRTGMFDDQHDCEASVVFLLRTMARDIWRVTDLALTCGSEPVVRAVAVVGSARTGRVLDGGSDHVGDTHMTSGMS